MQLNKYSVIKSLAIPLLLSLVVSTPSFAQNSSPSCVDTDGDGWGWTGTETCRVLPITCIDSDGDGWGWDGASTCRFTEIPTPQRPFSTQFCTDTDGDGWGWDGTDTCMIDQTVAGTCIDTDGDGWGWNGESSCFIDTQSGCIDTDGDGWGWNGYQTCRVSVDTTDQEPTNSCLINGASVNTDLSQPRCDALLDLYTSTDGNNWDNNDQWTTASDPCTWFGITCNNDEVIYVDLRNNGLTGSLPASINQLQGLSVLVLDENNLSGPLPDVSATSITFMDLGFNQLTGSIPASLGNLQLELLNLRHNQLTGPIPATFGSLSLVNILLLNDNQLSGSIPAELNNLLGDSRRLDLLGLQNNLLSGSLDGISNLQNHRPGIATLEGNLCFTATDPEFTSWLNEFVRDWDDGCF